MEVEEWRNMQLRCWTNWRLGPGLASCPTSSRKPRAGMKIPTTSSTRFLWMPATTCSAYWKCPTRMARPTGNTAASWASSGMAAASSGATATNPSKFPGVAHFHTIRVNQPSGQILHHPNTCARLMDLWDFRGSGLTNMHGDHRRHRAAGHHDSPAGGDLLDPDSRPGHRPGRFRLQLAHPGDLPGRVALRVRLLQHPGPLLQHDQGIPGRTAPPRVPLQVQIQVRRLSQRLRGLHCPLRLLGHRHLEATTSKSTRTP